jgi:hypothetical protein
MLAAQARVGAVITTLPRATMREVDRALAFALGFSTRGDVG